MDLDFRDKLQGNFPRAFTECFFGSSLMSAGKLPFKLPFKVEISCPEDAYNMLGRTSYFVNVVYRLQVVPDYSFKVPVRDLDQVSLSLNIAAGIREAAPYVYFMDPRKGLTVSNFYQIPGFAHKEGLDIVMASSFLSPIKGNNGLICGCCGSSIDRMDARWGTGLFLWVHNRCYREIEFCLYNGE